MSNSMLGKPWLLQLVLSRVASLDRDSEEFSQKLEHALELEPKPMTAELQRRLTWEDATERFLDVAELKASERPGVLETAVDKLAWVAHNTLTGTFAALSACSANCYSGLITFHCGPFSVYTHCQAAYPLFCALAPASCILSEQCVQWL